MREQVASGGEAGGDKLKVGYSVWLSVALKRGRKPLTLAPFQREPSTQQLWN